MELRMGRLPGRGRRAHAPWEYRTTWTAQWSSEYAKPAALGGPASPKEQERYGACALCWGLGWGRDLL